MLSKAKNLSSLPQLQKVWMAYTPDSYSYCTEVSTPLHQLFRTATAPLKAEVISGSTELLKSEDSSNSSESPELPGWVTFPGKGEGVSKREDDDFVPPSVLYWIENNKIPNQDAGMKNVVEDIVKSDIDKISKILKNPFESPDVVVKALDGCDVNLSDSLVEQVLKRFSFDWIPAFGFFRWAESRITLSPDLYNLMIDNLGKTKKFDLMWGLVREMNKLEGYVTLKTITKVMRRLAKTFQYDEAVQTFKEIEQFGIDKDVMAMNTLMDALVKEGSVERAEQVFLEFKDDIPPNFATYNVLVHGWCKTRMIDKAKKTVEEMKVHGFPPSSVTYTTFIEAYSREKDFRNVDATLKEMRKNGHPPNIVTYTIIVTALSRAKKINKVLEIYKKIKEEKCPIDASFCSVFIHALSKSGRVKDSEAVFYDMLKHEISPNILMYNLLIKLAAENLQEEKALKLLLEIEKCGLKPDLSTYTPLLIMCCKLNRMKVLTFLQSHMFKNDVSIDLGTYANLITGLCKIGKFERACQLFEEMVMKGSVPIEWSYQTLVGELEKNGMSKEKEGVERLMLFAKKQR